jgi:hypothetical protein
MCRALGLNVDGLPLPAHHNFLKRCIVGRSTKLRPQPGVIFVGDAKRAGQ